ncbi:D-arabinose 1-dehydrogenase-like Zn-dependent alcohol dehydrogenase [Catenulispora sp. GP43]
MKWFNSEKGFGFISPEGGGPDPPAWRAGNRQQGRITTMMRAAVVPKLGDRLVISELPVPEPGPGQVLIRMLTSGLCHTDIHAARGDWPVKPKPPFIPGHEGVGIVERTGPGASLHQVGDRVAMAWLGSACGHCRYCVSGRETLCEGSRTAATRWTAPGRSTRWPRTAMS